MSKVEIIINKNNQPKINFSKIHWNIIPNVRMRGDYLVVNIIHLDKYQNDINIFMSEYDQFDYIIKYNDTYYTVEYPIKSDSVDADGRGNYVKVTKK